MNKENYSYWDFIEENHPDYYMKDLQELMDKLETTPFIDINEWVKNRSN